MNLFADHITYCLYCGTQLEIGRMRCPDCERVARMPRWFWFGATAGVGLLSGGWALAQGASRRGAALSALATSVFAFVALAILVGHPTALVPHKRVTVAGAVAMLALILALSVPTYWSVLNDSEPGDAGVIAFVGFVVIPVLVTPLALLGVRRGWRTYISTCPRCDAYISPRGSYCGVCGREA